MLIDSAVAGILSLSVAGASNVVLTSTAGAADQSRNQRFNFTGTLTGNIYVLWPAGYNRFFSVANNTTGAFTLGLGVNNGSSMPVGSTVTVPQGGTVLAYSDGTNIVLQNGAGGLGVGTDTGTQNAMAATVAQASATNLQVVGVVAAYSNTSTTPTFALNSGSAVTITARGGQPLSPGDIPRANYVCLLEYNSATPNWEMMNPGGRVRLTTDTTFYVAVAGSDTTGTGAVGSPWASWQHAVNYIYNDVDPNGHNIAITDSNATESFAAGFSINGTIPGVNLTINGNGAIITAASPIQIVGCTNLTIAGFKLIASSGNALAIVNNAYVTIGASMNFGAVTGGGSHIYLQSQCYCLVNNSYTISGGATYHILSEGRVSFGNLSPATVTISGTPNFVYFVFATLAGNVQIASSSITWSGAATGTRYYSQLNAIIATSGSGATYFPGNVAGSTATGGQYA